MKTKQSGHAREDNRSRTKLSSRSSIYPGGVNFSLYSKSGTFVGVLMFDHVDDEKSACVSQARQVFA